MLIRKFICENPRADNIMMFDLADCVDKWLWQPWRFLITGSVYWVGSSVGDHGNSDVIFQTKRREVKISIEENRRSQELKLFQSRNLLCYTREWVKRKEKEILQHRQHSLYIQFLYHLRVIGHASMYHPNLIPWSYMPPAQLLISTTTPNHPTSQHLSPLRYLTKLPHHHLTTSFASPKVSAFRWYNCFHTLSVFRQ